MPRLPIDHSKTIIYKICCNDVNVKEVYVGHTTDLTRRRQRHKNNCNNEKCKEYDIKVYQFIRDNGGWDNWSLVPVEEYPCENVNQASIRERYWIETLQAELNKNIPSRSKKEYTKIYYQENKEKLREKNILWFENKKENIKCECGGHYIYNHKARHFKTKKHQDYLTTIIDTTNESSS